MAKKKKNIEPWEAAIIKKMLTDQVYTRDQIIAFFSQVDRPVSPFRISEIRKGVLHADVSPATDNQLSVFIRYFRSPQQAREEFFRENPLHPVNLATLFRVREGTSDVLDIDETDRVECKKGINFSNRSAYGRTIAGFANARGGFILFGVEDESKKVCGITPGKLMDYDSAKFNQFLSDFFSPTPLWEKTEIQIGSLTLGIIYVYPHAQKPIVASKGDGKDIREGDIYFRYPGETRRAKYAEINQIIEDRLKSGGTDLARMIADVSRRGQENIAILDTASGEISGRGGRFVIDESLLPKLRFVTEGQFSETEGQPTLRLIGELETTTIGGVALNPVKFEEVFLSDDDLIKNFIELRIVSNPTLYVKRVIHSQKIWLPVFYYMRLAGLSVEDACELMSNEAGVKPNRVEKLCDRIRTKKRPTGAPTRATWTELRQKIIEKSINNPETVEQCSDLCHAIRTLTPNEIDPSYIIPFLAFCFGNFTEGPIASELRYAIAFVDVQWERRESDGETVKAIA